MESRIKINDNHAFHCRCLVIQIYKQATFSNIIVNQAQKVLSPLQSLLLFDDVNIYGPINNEIYSVETCNSIQSKNSEQSQLMSTTTKVIQDRKSNFILNTFYFG